MKQRKKSGRTATARRPYTWLLALALLPAGCSRPSALPPASEQERPGESQPAAKPFKPFSTIESH